MQSGDRDKRLRGVPRCTPRHDLGNAAGLAALLGVAFAASAVATTHARTALAANGPAGRARLYTETQAEKGKEVYSQNCAACHGDQEQGASAPAIAGTAFLNKAQLLGWSVDNVRHLVVTTMPRNNPGSLSPEQYADVLAYLLAADCLPAGNSAFPAETTPALRNTPLQSPAGATPDNQKLGTCKLHGNG
jgi:polar amino acid transport system substrate-binding protein